MSRPELERLSKEELIELVLRLQRPAKTSRTSSKPPATDRKERRDRSKPGGAKPGHQGHSRGLSEDVDRVLDHHPDECPCCRSVLSSELPADVVSEHDKIDLPIIKPFVPAAKPIISRDVRIWGLLHQLANGDHVVGHLRFLGQRCQQPDPTEDSRMTTHRL